MRSDNRNNFVVAVKELQKSFQEMNTVEEMGAYRCVGQIGLTGSTISQQQVTLVESRRDTSEMPEVLNGESIHALLFEVEAIVQSRPMTTETISDIENDIPLLPANLLTVKSKLILTPLEYFTSAVESLLFNM